MVKSYNGMNAVRDLQLRLQQTFDTCTRKSSCVGVIRG